MNADELMKLVREGKIDEAQGMIERQADKAEHELIGSSKRYGSVVFYRRGKRMAYDDEKGNWKPAKE